MDRSLSEAMDGPSQNPLICWGGVWGRGWDSPAQPGFSVHLQKSQRPTLAEHSAPFEDPTWPVCHTFSPQDTPVSSRGQTVGTMGGGQGLDLSSAPPLVALKP